MRKENKQTDCNGKMKVIYCYKPSLPVPLQSTSKCFHFLCETLIIKEKMETIKLNIMKVHRGKFEVNNKWMEQGISRGERRNQSIVRMITG